MPPFFLPPVELVDDVAGAALDEAEGAAVLVPVADGAALVPVDDGIALEPPPMPDVSVPDVEPGMPLVPVLAGVAELAPVADVSDGVADVVLSGVLGGSLSPPQANAPATRAVLRTR